MVEGPADDRRAATEYRVPTDGDQPRSWAIAPALAIGAFAAMIAAKDDVGRRPGFALPIPVALAIGLGVALLAAVSFGLWIRRAPRDLVLRLGPDRLAFTQAGTERWSIRWADVASAGIVHSTLPASRTHPAPSYLRLELAEGTAPRDPSLHLHEGAWWFALVGQGTGARLHRDLLQRLPGLVRSVETDARLPAHLATHGRSARTRR